MTLSSCLDLRETWENTTLEECKDLVHVMLQEVGVDLAARRILWIKVRSDYEPLFAIMDGLHKDGDLRYWIEPFVAQADTRDIEACIGQMSAGVKTLPQVSHNSLTSAQEYIK